MRMILKSAALAVSGLALFPAAVLAQYNYDYNYSYDLADDTASGLFGLGSTALCCICGAVAWIVWAGLAVWVYKDAQKKGVDNPILWALLTFFFGFIGLLVYVLTQRNKAGTSATETK